jgi:cytochrome c biogenesis protein CcmG, thiol:disulfide interchange protein DsbE
MCRKISAKANLRFPAWLCRPLAIGVCLFALTGAADAADIGKASPDPVLRGSDGVEQKLSALRGKIVYLDFWASWCIPCRQSFPWMNDMQKKFAGQDVVILAVNLDAKSADADAFLAHYPATFRLAFDTGGASAKQFGVKAMPTSFLIGRDGTLLSEHRGFKDSQTEPVEAEIRQALAQK